MAKSNELPKDDLYKLRHSAAHVMAEAVVERYPEARVAIGPPIEEGFYYDFDLGRNADGSVRTFAPDDLEWIEGRMRQIIGGRFPFEYREVSAAEAKALFADEPYKLELIEGLERGSFDEYGDPLEEAPVISTYKHDTFEDLCRGPHVENTGK
ncbi:MAG: threonine--tRNA ligase, partial [Anaerolineae bacterium]|nr:threonine--tRNA ligase [Anaerolineae bacterium]